MTSDQNDRNPSLFVSQLVLKDHDHSSRADEHPQQEMSHEHFAGKHALRRGFRPSSQWNESAAKDSHMAVVIIDDEVIKPVARIGSSLQLYPPSSVGSVNRKVAPSP